MPKKPPRPDIVEIERLGGFAGFGGPGSRLRSRGTLDLNQLSSADHAAVEALFTTPNTRPHVSDGFRYRLRRASEGGRPGEVEHPEAAVPDVVRAAVIDQIE